MTLRGLERGCQLSKKRFNFIYTVCLSRLLMDLEFLAMKETRLLRNVEKPSKQRHCGISQRTGIHILSCHSKVTCKPLQLLVNVRTSFIERFLRDQSISKQKVLVVQRDISHIARQVSTMLMMFWIVNVATISILNCILLDSK